MGVCALMAAGALALLLLPAAYALDVNAMWDYDHPDVSEQRFRDALTSAKGNDALILRTQIVRTYSLRNRFDDAQRELDAIAPQLSSASAEVRVRSLLERGRTLRSAGKPLDARPLFIQAYEQADRAQLPDLAADALHMVALAEPGLESQLRWNRKVLAYVRRAGHEAALHWEGSALNNIGVALNDAGRHEDALQALQQALQAYQRHGRPEQVRYARGAVAYTLRLLGRHDEALGIQQSLEREYDALGQRDADVYEELALLYEARGDAAQAAHYRALQVQAAHP